MNKIETILKETIKNAVKKAFDIEVEDSLVVIEIPKDTANGDYSTNIAMRLTKQLHSAPSSIAEKIKEQLILETSTFDDVKVAGVGFINLWLNKSLIASVIKDVLDNQNNFGSKEKNGKKILVEYVSANPTGDLHIGHARGAAWGDSLTRILSYAGYEVLREYYINDAGNQIENLGKSLLARYQQANGLQAELPEDGYHGPDVKEIAEKIYQKDKDKWLNVDEQKALQFFKEEGKKQELEKIKNDLNTYRVSFDSWLSELSLYQANRVEKVISDLTEKGLVYTKDDAIWFKSMQFGDDKDRVLKKSDGSYTYLTPDIANHLYKIERGYDKLLNLWGADHHGYIARMQNALYAFGYPKDTLQVDIIQMVRIVKHIDGQVEEVKMSKRTGNAITLRDLIEEVGADAARYFFVSKALDTQMDFDMDLATSQSSDNPVYYAQYAHARMCSILNKTDLQPNTNKLHLLIDEKEIDLIKQINEFSDVIDEIATNRQVNKLCNYIQKLASLFHSFYNSNKVVSDDIELSTARLALVKATQTVLKIALNLIGVNALESM